MFKTFAQLILSAALSVGLAAGISPDVRGRLEHAWNKTEAVTRHVVDLAAQTAGDLAEKVSGKATIGASADVGTSISADSLSSEDAALDTSLAGELDDQGQTDVNGSASAKVQTDVSNQSIINSQTYLDILFSGSLAGK